MLISLSKTGDGSIEQASVNKRESTANCTATKAVSHDGTTEEERSQHVANATLSWKSWTEACHSLPSTFDDWCGFSTAPTACGVSPSLASLPAQASSRERVHCPYVQ